MPEVRTPGARRRQRAGPDSEGVAVDQIDVLALDQAADYLHRVAQPSGKPRDASGREILATDTGEGKPLGGNLARAQLPRQQPITTSIIADEHIWVEAAPVQMTQQVQ